MRKNEYPIRTNLVDHGAIAPKNAHQFAQIIRRISSMKTGKKNVTQVMLFVWKYPKGQKKAPAYFCHHGKERQEMDKKTDNFMFFSYYSYVISKTLINFEADGEERKNCQFEAQNLYLAWFLLLKWHLIYDYMHRIVHFKSSIAKHIILN